MMMYAGTISTSKKDQKEQMLTNIKSISIEELVRFYQRTLRKKSTQTKRDSHGLE